MDVVDEGTAPKGKRFVLVRQVVSGSPSAHAGIQAGDILIRINDRQISRVAEAREAILDLPAGVKATVVVRRGNEEKTIPVDVVGRPASPKPVKLPGSKPGPP